jgi:hypothetical protein
LLTQCFYNKKIKLPAATLSQYKGANTKKSRLLYKIIQYFSPKSILIIGPTAFEKEVIALANPKATIDIDTAIYNCIYFSSNNYSVITPETIEQLVVQWFRELLLNNYWN